MADWVQTQLGPGYMGGWAADMGVYRGPWPMLAPAEFTGLDGPFGDQVYFYLMLPNPAHPDDPNFAGDRTYDTPIWVAYRYWDGGAQAWVEQYYGDWNGPTQDGLPATPPSGAHIYVQTYIGFYPYDEPTEPPSFYVPSTYSALGRSAWQTGLGSWSDWQNPFDQTRTPQYPYQFRQGAIGSASPQYHNGWSAPDYPNNRDDSGQFDPDVNANVKATELLDGILATNAAPGDGTGSIGCSVEKYSKYHDVFLGPDQQFVQVATKTYLGVAVLDLSGFNTTGQFPPALGGFTYGLDYVPTPYIDSRGNSGGPYAYDTPGDTVPTDWSNMTLVYSWSLDGGAIIAVPPAMPIDIAWKPQPLANGTPLVLYYPDATPITTIDVAALPFAGSTFGTVEISLADVHVAGWTLYMQPHQNLTGVTTNPDIPMPAWPGDGDNYYDYGGEIDSDPSNEFSPSGSPTATFHFPRWHYWQPGPIIPVCPPGSKPRFTVIEGHWSDWQPGYTFTESVAAFSTFGGGHAVLAESPGYASDAHAMGHAALARLRTGAADDVFSTASPRSSEMLISSLKRPDLYTSAPTTSVSVDYRYWYLKQTAYASRPITVSPPVPPGVVFRTPPAGTPNVAVSVEFDGSTIAPFVNWADDSWFFQYVTHINDAAGTGPTLPNTRFRVGLVDPSLVTDYTTFLAYGTGITIAEQIFTAVSESPSYVPVPMVVPAGFADLSIAMAFQLGFLGPDDYPLPDYPYVDGFGNEYDVQLNIGFPPGLLPVYLTPRWRYWVPTQLHVDCIGHQYLRMTQRDDGLGIHGHPRLPITSMPTSQQLTRAPRVRGPNTYS